MNLYLLTNKYGRYSLEPGQKESARFVGIALAAGLIFLLFYFITEIDSLFPSAVLALALMIPLGSMNNADTTQGLKKLRYSAAGLTVLAVSCILLALCGSFSEALFYTFIFGLVAYQWFANYVLINE